jgi:cyclopropane fatty-acyl-phospholipid synthase-like methyltransferase
MKLFTQSKAERRHAFAGPASLWKMKRDFQIKFLINSNLKPHHYLLDIGCGTLRGGIPLIDYLQEDHYFGIESRKEVLDEGRKELKEEGLEWKNPTLLFTPDISKVSIRQKFDFMWAYSVLVHMTNDILNDTLNFVIKHLSDTGIFYANVSIGTREEGNWQGFPHIWRTLEFYNEACSRNRLIASDIGPLKSLGHISNDEEQDNQRMLKICANSARIEGAEIG